jgi:CRP/FNR family transcriptional regulator, cyclic AMP receptor protein
MAARTDRASKQAMGEVMDPLETVRLFHEMAPEARRRLTAHAQLLELRDGARVFAKGDPADAVYAIVAGEGSVRTGSDDRRGKSLMVEVFRAGDLFGEVAVIDGGTRSADAVVSGQVRVAKLGAAAFLSAVAEQPGLGLALSRLLARRIRRTFTLLQDATFEPLEVRLARQLVYLGTLAGQPTAEGIRLAGRFRQHELADLLGTTSRSIITILNTWRANQLVRFNAATGHLTIAPDQLLRLVEQTGG